MLDAQTQMKLMEGRKALDEMRDYTVMHLDPSDPQVQTLWRAFDRVEKTFIRLEYLICIGKKTPA